MLGIRVLPHPWSDYIVQHFLAHPWLSAIIIKLAIEEF